MTDRIGPALAKAAALIIIAIAAWVLLKVILNVVAAVAWVVAGVLALVAIAWAVSTLRSSQATPGA